MLWGCQHRIPQTGGLNTTEIHSVTAQEARHLKSKVGSLGLKGVWNPSRFFLPAPGGGRHSLVSFDLWQHHSRMCRHMASPLPVSMPRFPLFIRVPTGHGIRPARIQADLTLITSTKILFPERSPSQVLSEHESWGDGPVQPVLGTSVEQDNLFGAWCHLLSVRLLGSLKSPCGALLFL